jgi:thymidylate synthase ThyX
MNCWINSNSGDYVTQDNLGVYRLTLITRQQSSRYSADNAYENQTEFYLPQEAIVLTAAQFGTLKGFIPIKYKKLFNNRTRKTYGVTLSDGSKGKPENIRKVLSKAEARNEILKSLGL